MNQSSSLCPSNLIIRYKENPKFWTMNKLIDVLENSKNSEINDTIEIIKKHNLSVNDLFNLSQNELENIFSQLLPTIEMIKQELKDPTQMFISSSILLTETKEAEESYQFSILGSSSQFNTIESANLTNHDSKLNNQSISNLPQLQGVPNVQYTQNLGKPSKKQIPYDYDDYQNILESMEQFEEIVKNSLFLEIQNGYENYIKDNHKTYLQLKDLQDSDIFTLNDDLSNSQTFCKKLNQLSNSQAEIKSINKMFYIQDIGGNQPIFIKYDNYSKIPLFENNILMFGCKQFKIKHIKYEDQQAILNLEEYQSINKQKSSKDPIFINKNEQQIFIGSQMDSDIGSLLRQDINIQAQHAQLYYDGVILFLININQNDTWIRLSEQGKKSQLFSLLNACSIMFGQQVVQVSINQKIKNQQEKPLTKLLLDCNIKKCLLCKIEDRCVAVQPCNHKSYCQHCYNKVQPTICPNRNCSQKIIQCEKQI